MQKIVYLTVPVFIFVCFIACMQKVKQEEPVFLTGEVIEEALWSLPDTIAIDSIYIYADLLYDSISCIVVENHSHLPVTTDSGYRFEQKVHGKWKEVEVRKRDSAFVTIPAGGTEILYMEMHKDIGYKPLGACRIYKTFRAPLDKQVFELMADADARASIIDWEHVQLIADNTKLNDTFADMTAEIINENIFVTIHNKTGREILFGDNTNYYVSVYQNEQWYIISYARLIQDVAVVLPPDGSIKKMEHSLPYAYYHFKPGRYRITKEFFLTEDSKQKYSVAAEFILDSEIYRNEAGELVNKNKQAKQN